MFNPQNNVNPRNNQQSDATPSDDSLENTSTSNQSGHNRSEATKSDEGGQQNWSWRKLFKLFKDLGSFASLILTFVKILQELGWL